MAQIQNAGLDEFKLRDLNDEINKLLREKGHWEDRVSWKLFTRLQIAAFIFCYSNCSLQIFGPYLQYTMPFSNLYDGMAGLCIFIYQILPVMRMIWVTMEVRKAGPCTIWFQAFTDGPKTVRSSKDKGV